MSSTSSWTTTAAGSSPSSPRPSYPSTSSTSSEPPRHGLGGSPPRTRFRSGRVARSKGLGPAVRDALDAGGVQIVHVRTERTTNAASTALPGRGRTGDGRFAAADGRVIVRPRGTGPSRRGRGCSSSRSASEGIRARSMGRASPRSPPTPRPGRSPGRCPRPRAGGPASLSAALRNATASSPSPAASTQPTAPAYWPRPAGSSSSISASAAAVGVPPTAGVGWSVRASSSDRRPRARRGRRAAR